MEAVLSYLLPFAAFVVLYALLRRRARARGHDERPDAGRWLAAVVGCALIVALFDLLA